MNFLFRTIFTLNLFVASGDAEMVYCSIHPFYIAVFVGAAVCCILACTSAMYSSSDDVVELTAANFNSKVIQSDELWLVEFYAPW